MGMYILNNLGFSECVMFLHIIVAIFGKGILTGKLIWRKSDF